MGILFRKSSLNDLNETYCKLIIMTTYHIFMHLYENSSSVRTA